MQIKKMCFTDHQGVVTWGFVAYDSYGKTFNDTMAKSDTFLKPYLFMDKVIALSADCTELKDMLEAAIVKGTILFDGEVLEMAPFIEKVRDLTQE